MSLKSPKSKFLTQLMYTETIWFASQICCLPLLCHKMSETCWATWDWPALYYFIVSLPWTLWSIGIRDALVATGSIQLMMVKHKIFQQNVFFSGTGFYRSSGRDFTVKWMQFYLPRIFTDHSQMLAAVRSSHPDAVGQRTLFLSKSAVIIIISYSICSDLYMGQ